MGLHSPPPPPSAATKKRDLHGTGSVAFGWVPSSPSLQALGGAKNHAIIMPDADLDNAVSAMMGAAFGSCGERCMAVPVAVTVGDEVGDAFVKKITTEIAKMKVGPGTDSSNNMGPLITREHLQKVKGYVDLGVQEGAELVVDGRGLVVNGYENGFFLGGCLFDKVCPPAPARTLAPDAWHMPSKQAVHVLHREEACGGGACGGKGTWEQRRVGTRHVGARGMWGPSCLIVSGAAQDAARARGTYWG